MVDTIRSTATLLANMPVGGAAGTSVQDIRDMLVSLEPSVGGYYVSSAVATVFANNFTPVKALGTTTLTANNHNFDMPESNRLRYTGAAPIEAFVNIGVSITAGGNNKDTQMSIAKNGVVIPDSLATRKIGTGSDVGRAAVSTGVLLEENDYVEAFILNTTDTVTITYEHMTFLVQGFVI